MTTEIEILDTSNCLVSIQFRRSPADGRVTFSINYGGVNASWSSSWSLIEERPETIPVFIVWVLLTPRRVKIYRLASWPCVMTFTSGWLAGCEFIQFRLQARLSDPLAAGQYSSSIESKSHKRNGTLRVRSIDGLFY